MSKCGDFDDCRDCDCDAGECPSLDDPSTSLFNSFSAPTCEGCYCDPCECLPDDCNCDPE